MKRDVQLKRIIVTIKHKIETVFVTSRKYDAREPHGDRHGESVGWKSTKIVHDGTNILFISSTRICLNSDHSNSAPIGGEDKLHLTNL